MSRDHLLVISAPDGDLGGRQLICVAPMYSACRAVWDCDCERWNEWGASAEDHPLLPGFSPGQILPWHHYYGDDDEETHWGRFYPDHCNLKTWHAHQDEQHAGRIVVPVEPVWEDDFVTFWVGDES